MIKAVMAASGLLVLTPAAWAQSGRSSAAKIKVEYAWGYNYPRRQDREVLRPVDAIPWPDRWDLSSEYPPAALAAGSSGDVVVLVSVAADDRITNCVAVEMAEDPRLTDSVCPLVRRHGAFRHGLSASGRPIPGLVGLRFSFKARPLPDPPVIMVSAASLKPVDPAALVIEDAPAAVFPEREATVALDIDATGAVTHCAVFGSSGTDEGDVQLCRRATGIRFEPWRTSTGEAKAMKDGFVTFELRP